MREKSPHVVLEPIGAGQAKSFGVMGDFGLLKHRKRAEINFLLHWRLTVEALEKDPYVGGADLFAIGDLPQISESLFALRIRSGHHPENLAEAFLAHLFSRGNRKF